MTGLGFAEAAQSFPRKFSSTFSNSLGVGEEVFSVPSNRLFPSGHLNGRLGEVQGKVSVLVPPLGASSDIHIVGLFAEVDNRGFVHNSGVETRTRSPAL